MTMIMLPVLIRGTMRTIINPTWQFNGLLHSTTVSSCSAKSTKNVKTITPDIQSIMECEKHQTIKKELDKDSKIKKKLEMESFWLFSAEERPKVQARFSDISVGEVVKELDRRWAELDKNEKKKLEYEAASAEAKVKYLEEKNWMKVAEKNKERKAKQVEEIITWQKKVRSTYTVATYSSSPPVQASTLPTLQPHSFTDILVSHILELNINVPKLSLENNIIIFKPDFRAIGKNLVPKHVSSKIKIGGYTKADDEIIKTNWNMLLTEVDLKKVEVKVMMELFDAPSYKDNKLLGFKRNILGFFLSQNLPDVRLAADVQHRAKLLLWRRSGKFTPEEDEIIMDLDKMGVDEEQWKELALLLRRKDHTSLKHRYGVLKSKKEGKLSGKMDTEEDEIIILKVFEFNPKILDEGEITMEQWEMIGTQLNRSSLQVYNRWRSGLQPTLKRYHAGTLSTDIRQDLVTHMIENNLYYAQDVDFKELVKLPQFAGTTTRYIGQQLANMQECAMRKHPEKTLADVTAETLQNYLDNRGHSVGADAMKRNRDAYRDSLVDFYVTNILNKKNGSG